MDLAQFGKQSSAFMDENQREECDDVTPWYIRPARDLSRIKIGNTKNPPIVSIIDWILDPSLSHRLVFSAILVFILLSLIVRFLAHSLPKEEGIVSVKELAPVQNSLDAVSKELYQLQEQQLQEISKRVMALADQQFISSVICI